MQSTGETGAASRDQTVEDWMLIMESRPVDRRGDSMQPIRRCFFPYFVRVAARKGIYDGTRGRERWTVILWSSSSRSWPAGGKFSRGERRGRHADEAKEHEEDKQSGDFKGRRKCEGPSPSTERHSSCIRTSRVRFMRSARTQKATRGAFLSLFRTADSDYRCGGPGN